MTKKLLSLLVAVFMFLTVLPVGALAAKDERGNATAARAVTKSQQVVASWDFETDPTEDGWQFIDKDEDGHNWSWNSIASYANSPSHSIKSCSYEGGALNPDNWAISPAVELPEGAITLSYYGRNRTPSYPETFGIYVGTSADPDEMDSVTGDIQFTGNGYEIQTADLSDYAGQTVYIAFRHYNCTDQWELYIDDVTVTADDDSTQPEPVDPEPVDPEPATGELIAGYYFEADEAIDDWDFTDADGDGDTWIWQPDYSETPYCNAYEGEGLIYSRSYDNSTGPLTPDNWAISPEVTIPEGESYVSFYAAGQDANYAAEHFAVYAGSDADNMTQISDELVATGTYTQYKFDLSDFAGQTIRVAIRHFNVTDMFYLNVDQFEIFAGSGETPEPVDPEPVLAPITEICVNGFELPPVAGEAATDHLNLSVPEDVHYHIYATEWSPEWWDNDVDDEFFGTFVEGTSYSVGLTLEADEGYYFADDCEFLVDGSAEKVDTLYTGVDDEMNNYAYLWTLPEICIAGESDPEPVDPEDVTFEFEYASEDEIDWTFVDKDGDGNNWFWNIDPDYGAPHNGEGMLVSESYNNNVGPYTPDNWAITPTLYTNDLSKVTFSMWANAQDASYPSEHFAIYVGNSADPDAMIMLNEWDMVASVTRAQGTWYQYTVDLEGVSGITTGEIYFAIRHFNCTDWFRLNVDDVTVTGVTYDYVAPEPVDPEPVDPEPVDPGEGDVTVVLNVPTDIWEDGSGYQMLLDADATAYGTIIPESGPFTSSGNAPAGLYDNFEYKIPVNADGNLNTTAIVVTGSVSIVIPAGTYDWCIANPTPGDRLWIGSELGNVGGRYDDYVFEAGKTYTFTVTLDEDEGYDRTDVTISEGSEPVDPEPSPEPVPAELIAGYYFEADEAIDDWNFTDADGDGNTWIWQPDYSETPHCAAYEGEGLIYSKSYDNSTGPLTPDNWAISPEVTIPEGESYVSFYAAGQDADYAAEHFAVYAGSDADNMTQISDELVATGTYTQYKFDLSDFAGQTIRVAIRHFNVTDMFYLNVDQFEIFAGSGETPEPVDPEPAPENLVEGFYFETQEDVDAWTMVDEDGDGHNWMWNETYPHDELSAHEGEGAIVSESYDNDTYNPLSPDNWAISPEVTIPEGGANVSFYAMTYGGYGEEHLAVYAGPDVDNMIEIMAETGIPESSATNHVFTQYTVDLSEFAGQTIRIALRHFNSYDYYMLGVDRVEIFAGETEPAPEPQIIDTIVLENLVVPVYGANPTYNVTVPADAHYTLEYQDWNWWDLGEEGGMMDPSDVFDQSLIGYYMYFELTPEEGYEFASSDELLITINGNKEYAEYFGVEDGILYIYTCDFFVSASHLLGDVDLNGTVTMNDALLTLRYLLGLGELTDEQLAMAEVVGDEEITMTDALLILRYAQGLIDVFPAELRN